MSKSKATVRGRRESFCIPSETVALLNPNGDVAEFIRSNGAVIREAIPRELRVGFVYPILEETETNVTIEDETTLNLGAASSSLLLNEGNS